MTRVTSVVLALVSSAGSAFAQEGQADGAIDLVARAERLFTESAPEDAILLLWVALERLCPTADKPASAAGITAALGVLKTHDPLHAERLTALAAVARAQVDLALLYRGKRWVLSAADCLDLADRFDAAASRKERAQLATTRPAGGEPSITEPRGYSLLKSAEVVRAEGPWCEVGDTLECDRHPAKTPWYEWTVDAQHEDTAHS
ncbi:MAG TPA: hypothetical protein VF384_19120 [Planctomycetota bacterium]